MFKLVVKHFGRITCVCLLLAAAGCGKTDAVKSQQKSELQTTLTSNTQPNTAPLPGEVAFTLKYQGWDEKQQKNNLGGSSGYGVEKTAKTPFTQGLTSLTASTVIYPALPYSMRQNGQQQDYAALECDSNGKALALYIDLNNNGKLDDGEKILPSGTSGVYGSNSLLFITPDFEVSRDKKTFLCRMAASTYMQESGNKGVQTSGVMWSSACSLEGSAILNGQERRLTLYDSNAGSGEFTTCGNSSYSLLKTSEINRNGGYPSRQTLSRLICVDEQYYEVRFSEDKQKVFLSPSVLPMSALCVLLNTSAEVKTRDFSLNLVGQETPEVNFSISDRNGKPIDLPALTYRIQYGNFICWPGPDEDPYKNDSTRKKLWRVSFREANPLVIPPNQIVYAEFGKLKASVIADSRENHYRSTLTTQTVFQQGDSVMLTCMVKGQLGEVYDRFNQDYNYKENQPSYKITDTSGTLIASGVAANYAQKGGTGECSWETQNAAPGKYTVVMEQNTGPLAGKLEGRTEIELRAKPTGLSAGVSALWGKR
ncbi:TPA: hypothetical protein DDW35_13210 [Candidatus Sumerlaeota bacterium]|jgi:hypothetical protein|nr:hypothetical protein [Candidatus Sumerlaeota bacterium]